MKIIDNWDYVHKRKIFPELPDEIPNEKLSEDWANRIHGQTLERLNERGGLSIAELIMNLKRQPHSEYIAGRRLKNHETTQADATELLTLLI